MNVTAEVIGELTRINGVRYISYDTAFLWFSVSLLILFLLGMLGGLAFEMYLNSKWRRILIDTGNEEAYLDVIKAKKKFVKTDSVQMHED